MKTKKYAIIDISTSGIPVIKTGNCLVFDATKLVPKGYEITEVYDNLNIKTIYVKRKEKHHDKLSA